MRLFYALTILIALAYVVSRPPAAVAIPIYDVSWPQCASAKPAFTYRGVVGVTGGLSLRPNPCLGREAGWFSRVGAYINTGYPGPAKAAKFKDWPKRCNAKNEKCLAYNYGFNAARYAINQASLNGVLARHWWLDVETENSWSDDVGVNRQALLGGYDALSAYTGRENVGYYSHPSQWNIITGRWLNGVMNWTASGGSNPASAAVACQAGSFTGGLTYMAQFTSGLDQNILCSQNTSALFRGAHIDSSF